jgi:mRNA interferase YafQ
MLQPIYKKKFEKDLKRVSRRSNDTSKLKDVITDLIHEKPLDKKLLDHPLKGEYADCRECHIEPDWLLIYFIEKEFITFVRTGTHADLFG